MRLEGWELRLAAVIERSRSEPYELGRHDCFRVACAAIEALTGVDHWPRFEGRYKTRRQALVLIAREGSSFEAAGDRFFGAAAVDPRLARRGDIVAIQTEDGEKHLGVCLGVQAAFTAPDGVRFIPTLTCLCAWKVG